MHPAFAVESHKLLMLWKYLQESVRREATQVTQGLTQFSLLLQSCPPPSSSPDVRVTSPFLPADLPPVAHLQRGDELWSRCFSSIQVSKDSRLRFHCLADLYVALLNPYRFFIQFKLSCTFLGSFFLFFQFDCSVKDGIHALWKAHMCSTHLSEVSAMSPLKQFQCSSDWWWPSLTLSFFHASLVCVCYIYI